MREEFNKIGLTENDIDTSNLLASFVSYRDVMIRS